MVSSPARSGKVEYLQGLSCLRSLASMVLADCSTESTEVTLDPAEHQAYQWITKKEVIEWGVDNIVTPEQRDMILLAFEQHDKMKVKRGRC